MKNLLDYLVQSNKTKRYYVNINPTWYSTLHIASSSNENYLSIHNNNQYIHSEQNIIVFGDVWLSNKKELLAILDIGNSALTDLDIIALFWRKFGIDCIPSFRGMFAFCTWDKTHKKLYLVRDQVGAKTLYYIKNQSGFYVSSRLKNLDLFHSKELNIEVLMDYLCCSFVPGQNTFWKGVKEIAPGCILELPTEQIKAYWQLKEILSSEDYPIEWYRDKLREKLEYVVQEYLPKDQSLGLYLSGGLDSSCITALAAQYHNQGIHTYSIHFGAECPHELKFSSLVAKHCKTQHHILGITPKMMWENLPDVMSHLDDPIGDPLTVPNYLLGQLAKQDCQIILNGEGGDPCFGGPKNQPMLLSQIYGGINQNPDLLTIYLTSFKKCFFDLDRLLKPDLLKQFQSQNSVFSDDLYTDAKFLNRLMLLNIKFKGADHILTKVSNLTNSANIQGRSPLFDPRIVEIAMSTPPEYKVRGAEEKAVLKEAVRDLLPSIIIDRPKSGMRVPVQYFFREHWQRQAKSLLLSRRAKIRPYLNQELIRDWLNYHGDLWGRYGTKLWLLVSLEMWLQVNQD